MAINKFECDCCGHALFSMEEDLKHVSCPECGIAGVRRKWYWSGPETAEEYQAIYEVNAKQKRNAKTNK